MESMTVDLNLPKKYRTCKARCTPKNAGDTVDRNLLSNFKLIDEKVMAEVDKLPDRERKKFIEDQILR